VTVCVFLTVVECWIFTNTTWRIYICMLEHTHTCRCTNILGTQIQWLEVFYAGNFQVWVCGMGCFIWSADLPGVLSPCSYDTGVISTVAKQKLHAHTHTHTCTIKYSIYLRIRCFVVMIWCMLKEVLLHVSHVSLSGDV